MRRRNNGGTDAQGEKNWGARGRTAGKGSNWAKHAHESLARFPSQLSSLALSCTVNGLLHVQNVSAATCEWLSLGLPCDTGGHAPVIADSLTEPGLYRF